MEVEPHTRWVRWYECGCREVEDSDSIQWETTANGDPLCGDDDQHPHGKLIREVFQRAVPVPVTNTEWVFDEPE